MYTHCEDIRNKIQKRYYTIKENRNLEKCKKVKNNNSFTPKLLTVTKGCLKPFRVRDGTFKYLVF